MLPFDEHNQVPLIYKIKPIKCHSFTRGLEMSTRLGDEWHLIVVIGIWFMV
jgi:hypothetical protein